MENRGLVLQSDESLRSDSFEKSGVTLANKIHRNRKQGGAEQENKNKVENYF